MKKTKSVNIFWTMGLFSKNIGTAADLLVAEESMAGLGSAAATATATARERGEKYNLLHERFLKLGAPLMVVLVCFAQGVGPYLLGENSSPSNQLAIWY
jgi:hypothetical protein